MDTDPFGADLMKGSMEIRDVIMTLVEEGGIMSGEPFMEEQDMRKDMGI